MTKSLIAVLLLILLGTVLVLRLRRTSRRPVPSVVDTVELVAEYHPDDGLGRWTLRPLLEGSTPATLELELGPRRSAADSPRFSFARGILRGRAERRPVDFLAMLQQALAEGAAWQERPYVDSLTLDVGILGENLTRGAGDGTGSTVAGEFTTSPAGSWLVTKLFLQDGEAEVFLALDPISRRALLIRKDPEYGPDVMAELARLFR